MKAILPFFCLLATALSPIGVHAQTPPPGGQHLSGLSAEMDPLVQNMDPAVRPGDDFFRYACGRWIKDHPIPASERDWGVGDMVQQETYRQLRTICESAAAAHAPQGTNEQKVGDFWSAGMDSARIEEQGLAPLRPELEKIEGIRSRGDLLRVIADFQSNGIRALYGMYIGQDERNSEKEMIHLVQGGLHLPDRDYYFKDDPATDRIRTEYLGHLVNMFRLLGDDSARAQQESQVVMGIERNLAGASRTLERRRDPWANYNKMSLARLNGITPSIEWGKEFGAMGIPPVDSVIVEQPEFYAQVETSLTTASLEDWKIYLRWCLMTHLADRLSSPVAKEDFRFYETVMGGVQAQRPRWKRVLDAEGRAIGELMGQIWVQRYCSPATKERYLKLVDNIFEAYRDRIRRLPWMSEPTKEKALEKLGRVTKKVAYPDHWRDYFALEIGPGLYAENLLRTGRWWFNHDAAKLGKPVDRTEWDMDPQTYNAYYDESNLEIVLPAAAFVVPGLPDSMLDDAILYSYAGASTIGHELTHGFDDEGRQYDARGNLNTWWTAEDSIRFTERSRKLVDQFDQFVVGHRHVRGFATLGENIADLGGIIIGYEAFKKTEQWKRGDKLNGLTPDQRFFLGYALAWLGDQRPEALDQQIMTDVHAPRALRVNGPLADLPEFYQAFGVGPGDPMFRPDSLRAQIW